MTSSGDELVVKIPSTTAAELASALGRVANGEEVVLTPFWQSVFEQMAQRDERGVVVAALSDEELDRARDDVRRHVDEQFESLIEGLKDE